MKARHDAVVIGGSFAGAASAVALAREGLDVLLLEPGLADARRLAGELIQAPGVEALAGIGLLDAVWAAGAVASCGFAIVTPDSEPVVLSYAESEGCHPNGLAIEHATLARVLLDTAAATANVTLVRGRVTSVRQSSHGPAQVTISEGGSERTIDTDLVVAADGRMSKTRESAGISVKRSEGFRMLGCKLDGEHLPFEGFGHVFLGGRRPILCYRVAADSLRIMFELTDDAADKKQPCEADLDVLPARIATAVRREFAAGRGISAMVFGLSPERAAAGRVALVGDSGGCVHPITATGVSFCFKDAALLARCVARSPGDVPRALLAYNEERARPMLTRVLLGPLLAEALGDPAPEMKALRDGLLLYWRRDRSGRAASMGLLSTHEPSKLVLAREYAKVAAYAFLGLVDAEKAPPDRVKIALALGKRAVKVARDVLAP
ncbi:MAG: FAD-dependent monooxygenase [Deltaproteobacteria bacterium]|nr:FAD-dependent monooxygenase [Deltaproteobacteria bacterium]